MQHLTSAAEEKLGEMFFILVDPVSSAQALSYFGIQVCAMLPATVAASIVDDSSDQP